VRKRAAEARERGGVQKEDSLPHPTQSDKTVVDHRHHQPPPAVVDFDPFSNLFISNKTTRVLPPSSCLVRFSCLCCRSTSSSIFKPTARLPCACLHSLHTLPHPPTHTTYHTTPYPLYTPLIAPPCPGKVSLSIPLSALPKNLTDTTCSLRRSEVTTCPALSTLR